MFEVKVVPMGWPAVGEVGEVVVVGAAVTSGASGEAHAVRLREARNVLGRATRASAGRRAEVSEVSEAGERLVPVPAPLSAVLPGGGLRRGSTIAVGSSTSLLFALLSEASAGGTWCALVGFPEAGMVAAAEAGLALSRVALVPRPGADLVAVTAALLDGLDLVAVAGVDRLGAGDRQRLAARARMRGAVLLPVGPWPGADLRVEAVSARWRGVAGRGAGRLSARRARVRVSGRGAGHRERAVTVQLPGPGGAVAGPDGLSTRERMDVVTGVPVRAAG
ncbi:MAG TPA: hypothetical protein VGH99_18460 [Pseudonocardia sp.]|jgi:hypothetical protein